MKINQLIIIVALSIGLGVLIYNIYFTPKAIVKRKLKRAVGKKISDFVSGDIAKVVGTVVCVDKPLIAPLSGRPCAYYRIIVEQHHSTGKSSRWETIVKEEQITTFLIKDGRNYAFINSGKTMSYVVSDWENSSGFLNDASENLKQFLQRHGVDSENILGLNKTLRYKEAVLEPGEIMAVMGRGEWKSASLLKLPESYNRVLELTSSVDEPLYFSDDPDTVETIYPNAIVQ